MCAERHILLNNDSKIPHNVTGGQGNPIQNKYLVRQYVSMIFRASLPQTQMMDTVYWFDGAIVKPDLPAIMWSHLKNTKFKS